MRSLLVLPFLLLLGVWATDKKATDGDEAGKSPSKKKSHDEVVKSSSKQSGESAVAKKPSDGVVKSPVKQPDSTSSSPIIKPRVTRRRSKSALDPGQKSPSKVVTSAQPTSKQIAASTDSETEKPDLRASRLDKIDLDILEADPSPDFDVKVRKRDIRREKGKSWAPQSRKERGRSWPVKRDVSTKPDYVPLLKMDEIKRPSPSAQARVPKNAASSVGSADKSDSNMIKSAGKGNDDQADSKRKQTVSKQPSQPAKKSGIASSSSSAAPLSEPSDTPGGKLVDIQSPNPRRKVSKEKALTGLSVVLNYAELASTDEISGEEADEKDALLKKEQQAKMTYNDLVSVDGMTNKKTITITGLSGATPGNPAFDNRPGIHTVPSGMFLPQARQRKKKQPGMLDQLQKTNDMLTAGGVNPLAGANHDLFAYKKPQAQQQQAMVPMMMAPMPVMGPDGALMYVYGNVPMPGAGYPPDDDDFDPFGEDELENSYLVKAIAKNGKQRVITTNITRFFYILIYIGLNVAAFLGLEFGAIKNIVNPANTTH